MLTAWGCLLVGGQYVLVAFLPIYVNLTGKVSLKLATLVLVAVAQVGAIVGRIIWGIISDRVFHGRRRALQVLLSSIGVGVMLCLALVPGNAPLAVFAAAAFFGGLSVMGWQGVFVRWIAELAGVSAAGAATGFALTFIALAIVASPPLFGLVADLAGGYRTMWAVLGLVVLISLVPAYLGGKATHRRAGDLLRDEPDISAEPS
jgi:MFS family permease